MSFILISVYNNKRQAFLSLRDDHNAYGFTRFRFELFWKVFYFVSAHFYIITGENLKIFPQIFPKKSIFSENKTLYIAFIN